MVRFCEGKGKSQLFGNAQMGKKALRPEGVSHSALTGFARSDLLAAKKDPACVYWAESANGLEERCFSASAFAYGVRRTCPRGFRN